MAKDMRISTIDGLKFLLFLRIFLFHCGYRWASPVWGGVENFLVITAFLLSYKWLARDRSEVKPLYLFKRRILRLYPAYFALVIPLSIAFILYKHRLSDDLFYYFFSAQSFYWAFTESISDLVHYTAHTWFNTLTVYLFLLWVILLRYVPREKLKAVCIVVIVLAFAHRTLSILLTDNFRLSYMVPTGLMDTFAIGCLLAINLREDEKMEKNKRTCAWDIGIGLLGIVLMTIYVAVKNGESLWNTYSWHISLEEDPLTVNYHFFVSLMGAGLIRYSMTSIKHPIIGSDLFVTLGKWIYSLYIFHWPIIQITRLFIDSKMMIAIVSLIAALATAFLWDKFIEPYTNKLLKFRK